MPPDSPLAPSTTKGKDPRIAIIGAGPAGLSTARSLKKLGFHDVTVFEKLGRVGGLCHTITMDGKSFDLGANYLTADYAKTLEIAAEVGADTFPTDGIQLAHLDGAGRIVWQLPPPSDPEALIQAMSKYLAIRKTLTMLDGPVIRDLPDDLKVSLTKWLEGNDLSILIPVFWLPITVMGYGFPDEIPAPYALKFLSPATFLPIYLRTLPQTQGVDPDLRAVIPWPRKFKDGFQRLWERVSWELDVRLNVDIQRIERTSDGRINIKLQQKGQLHGDVEYKSDEREFEILVFASPLHRIGRMIDLDNEEATVFDKLRFNSYVVSSYYLEEPIDQITMEAVAFVPPQPLGAPWAIAQIWKGESRLVQFYNRVDPATKDSIVFRELSTRNEKVLDGIPARIDREETWTYDRWSYFPHFSVGDVQGDILDRLDDLQGRRSTYFAGGGSHFESVESAVEHGEYIAGRIAARHS